MISIVSLLLLFIKSAELSILDLIFKVLKLSDLLIVKFLLIDGIVGDVGESNSDNKLSSSRLLLLLPPQSPPTLIDPTYSSNNLPLEFKKISDDSLPLFNNKHISFAFLIISILFDSHLISFNNELINFSSIFLILINLIL